MMEWIVTSSVLILLVLALRRLLRDKISLRLRYALWLVVAVRLLAPFSFGKTPLPVTAANLAPESGPRWEFPRYQVNEIPLTEVENSPFYVEPDGTVIASDSFGFPELDEEAGVIRVYVDFWSPKEIALTLWGLGAALTATALVWANLRFARGLRKRRRVLEGPDSPISVYVAEGLPSPCLFGVLRPAVYLTPQAAEDGAVRAHVLAHELTHYAHFDHIWAVVRAMCLVIHWYNPLVWLAAYLSKGDGELACDEGAVARLGEEQRIPYGRTLVGLVAQRGSRPADLLSCSTSMTGGKKTIQQRVALLVKKPETKKAALFAALALLALAVLFTFSKSQSDGPCEQFLAQVEETQFVNISQSSVSSQYVPYHKISDQDLLAEAKKLLAGAKKPGKIPEDVDWVIEDLRSPYLRLGDWADGDSLRYSLHKGMLDGAAVTYVLMRTDGGEEPFSCTPVAILDGAVEEQLWDLAKRQYDRDRGGPVRYEIRDPGDVTAVQELLVRDINFLDKNAELWGSTRTEIVRWVTGGGNSPAPVWLAVENSDLDIPELESVAPCWTVTCWGEDQPLYVLYLPGETLAAVLSRMGYLEGTTAMLARDVQVENPYIIYSAGEGEPVVQQLSDYECSAYDMAVVIQDKGKTCEVEFISLDAEPLRGTVQKSDLIFDPAQFRFGKQARLKGATMYDSPDGMAMDTEIGTVIVSKRWMGWAQILRPGGVDPVWVKESDLFYDFSQPYQEESAEKPVPRDLTDKELAWFNEEFFNGDGFNFHNQFLISLYDRPEDIDLYQLFYSGTSWPGASMSAEEEQKVWNQGNGGRQPDCATSKLTRVEMDMELYEHTLLMLDQTSGVGLDKFVHLPEYDAYYLINGDTNYVRADILSGTRSGDTVNFFYYNSFADAPCRLTLNVAGGKFFFVANQTVEMQENVRYWVEYPEYKTALTKLFLEDEETVARNETENKEMAEWLNKWTSAYSVEYGVPWWIPDAQEAGWYARAMDAGSFYSIAIPDHLIGQVSEICREEARYYSWEMCYNALNGADTVYYCRTDFEEFSYKITDVDVVGKLLQLLTQDTNTSYLSESPGRVDVASYDACICVPIEGVWMEFFLQETGKKCLMAVRDQGDAWEDSLPVILVLPSGTSEKVNQIVDQWQTFQPQSAASPAYPTDET